MNINNVTLMGRLTADPELKISKTGVPVTRFTIAVNRRFKSNEADFIDCTCFNKTAETVAKYFTKGSAIIAFGALQVDSWTDKYDNKRKSYTVMVNDFLFGESKSKEGSGESKENDLIEVDELPF